ncbi:SDR family oxidoreductase [Ruegeria sp. HKCCA5426]|uniref:SDR family oxidoreductase n=1 Tax=Ruegeria sp. HKCCA5426 TaxID=2682985 RepID=UPI0014897E47|nr:SDR family NAD(P)-dependent oxidoreductase [Ruegeria sp. HKCCA5426]
MEIEGQIVVVTGAASGIGKALAAAFAAAGAKSVVCADLNLPGAEETANQIGGVAIKADVSKEDDIAALIDRTETEVGPIGIFCSNAGILSIGGPETDNDIWQGMWEVNVMSHIWAARHVVPRMIERGGGYLLNTASAAGLLNQVGSMAYGVTKHAAVGAAEWLAFTYRDQGIGVSLLCPQAVRSEMTRGHEDGVASQDGMLEAEPVAEACLQAIRDETFLILPHPEVLGYMRNKTDNYDRWLGGMRKLNRFYGAAMTGTPE